VEALYYNEGDIAKMWVIQDLYMQLLTLKTKTILFVNYFQKNPGKGLVALLQHILEAIRLYNSIKSSEYFQRSQDCLKTPWILSWRIARHCFGRRTIPFLETKRKQENLKSRAQQNQRERIQGGGLHATSVISVLSELHLVNTYWNPKTRN